MESDSEHQNASASGKILKALSIALRIIKSTFPSLVPFPLISPSASLLFEVLAPRTLEENLLIFQTRSQQIGSLSTVVGLLPNKPVPVAS
jgi:hypothetical protein